ncbi:uncharacterized protein [Asterias amurensis]|uniref:uncharacterized protein isoform X2 n=1 Tax=Asterias amurensis TaxID=7602 RepID=UPI003AB48911
MTSVCCGIVCGECRRGGFLSQQQPGEGSQSSKIFVCPDCTEEITLVELHADVQAEEGTPRKIDQHVQYSCAGKRRTDRMFELDQMQMKLSQHDDDEAVKPDEGPRICPYKCYGCTFWGTPRKIDQHVQNSCAGKVLTDRMFELDQMQMKLSQHDDDEAVKPDEGPRICPYKCYGCTFWGTPRKIDQHVQNSCAGKVLTDRMFQLDQMKKQLSQHYDDEGPLDETCGAFYGYIQYSM